MGAAARLSPRRAYPRKVEITRAIEAAKACGIKVGGVRVTPEGAIEIMQADAIKLPQDEYEMWKDRL